MCDHSPDSYPVGLPVGMKMHFVTHHVMYSKTRVSVSSIIRIVLFILFLSAYACERIQNDNINRD
jgi:hypothetical protein